MILNRAATRADLDPASWHPAVQAAQEWLLRGQHPCRGWEYSQALYAYERYAGARASVLDVGGAGSLAYQLCLRSEHLDRSYSHVTRVDPALPTSPDGLRVYQDPDGSIVCSETLEEYQAGRVVVPTFRCVLCLSVLEHVQVGQEEAFLRQLAAAVAPGGLLVLTFDLGEDHHTDLYHFRWMRGGWIPCSARMQQLYDWCLHDAGLRPVRMPNYRWPGPVVYDYTVASLILQREPRR